MNQLSWHKLLTAFLALTCLSCLHQNEGPFMNGTSERRTASGLNCVETEPIDIITEFMAKEIALQAGFSRGWVPQLTEFVATQRHPHEWEVVGQFRMFQMPDGTVYGRPINWGCVLYVRDDGLCSNNSNLSDAYQSNTQKYPIDKCAAQIIAEVYAMQKGLIPSAPRTVARKLLNGEWIVAVFPCTAYSDHGPDLQEEVAAPFVVLVSTNGTATILDVIK